MYPASKTAPWDHQKKAWELSNPHDGYYFALDMGCVSKDTMISINRAKNSRKVPISKAYEWFHSINRTKRWDNSIPMFTKSLGKDGILYLNKIIDIIYKGTKNVVKLTLESDKTLILTPDHEILTKNNEYVAIEKLKVGDKAYSPKEDLIKSIEPYGQEEVYDIIMKNPHRNFAANDIIIHNCGKSKVAIDYLNGKNIRTALIICPKSVIPVWPLQFNMHSDKKWIIIPLQKGSVKKRADILKTQLEYAAVANQPIAFVINYDSFWREPLGPVYNKKNRMISKGILMDCNFDAMVLDEAHRIKSPGGKASWGAYRLSKKIKHKLLLSGTPMPHNPTDVYGQFRVLDPKIFGTSFQRFKMRYCIMGGFENRQIVKFINMDELNRLFYSRAFLVKKDEVLDLPDFMHETRTCDLDPKTWKIYKELEQDFISFIDNKEINVNNALTKLLRLSQIASGYLKLDDGTEKIIDSSKLNTLKDLLEDLPLDEPVIIFCRFTSEIKRVREMVEKNGRTTAELSGQENSLKEWQDGQLNTVVIQIRAGGEGIDLTRACYCVYFNKGFPMGEYEQSLARPHRPGQTRKVTYYHIIAEKTVDEKVEKALKEKKDTVAYVLEDLCSV